MATDLVSLKRDMREVKAGLAYLKIVARKLLKAYRRKTNKGRK